MELLTWVSNDLDILYTHYYTQEDSSHLASILLGVSVDFDLTNRGLFPQHARVGEKRILCCSGSPSGIGSSSKWEEEIGLGLGPLPLININMEPIRNYLPTWNELSILMIPRCVCSPCLGDAAEGLTHCLDVFSLWIGRNRLRFNLQ